MISLIMGGKVHLLIKTVSGDKRSEREASVLRRTAVENAVPCLTSLDAAAAPLEALEARIGTGGSASQTSCLTIDEYCALASVSR